MKKTDLYRSINGIKQDACLKEQILKAAEENDVVTVIKRPVFVPVMIALLLCLNVGMAAKLVIFNKSQVNMSEFKARTNMSSAADLDSELEEMERELDALKQQELNMQKQKEAAEMQQSKFEAAKAEFLGFIESEKSCIYYEMEPSGNNVTDEPPEFLVSDTAYQENENNNFRRYIEVIDYPEVSADEFNYSYSYAITNHEYIIGYDGNGFDNDNIVSITKSKAEPEDVSEDMILSALETFNSNESQEKISKMAQEKMEEFEGADESESNYAVGNYYYFYSYSKTSTQIVFQIRESVLCYDGSWADIQFYVDENGEDVTDHVESLAENYWNETIYSPDIESYSKVVTVPNVTGMSAQEAQKAIEDAGLKVSSRYYEPPTSEDFVFNDVFATYPQPGTAVSSGTDIELRIYARMMPDIYNYTLDSAKEIFKKMGLKVKLEYEDGVDPNSNELYVSRFSPQQYTVLKEGEEVTLYLADPNTYTAADLIGCAINLDDNSYDYRKIYSIEETQEVLADYEDYTEATLELGYYGYYYYNDFVFYGKYYGNIFLVESFRSGSEFTNSVPFLHCGSEESDIEGCLDTEFYSSLKAEVIENEDAVIKIAYDNPAANYQQEVDYMLRYTPEGGKEIRAYFDTEDGSIIAIYVTADENVNLYEGF